MSRELLERFITDAHRAGCPEDQVTNFLQARVILQPRQLMAAAAARQCDHEGGPTKVGFGGARGGGKSHFAFAQVSCDDCQRFPGLKFLYLRKLGKAAREAVQDLRREVLHSTPHEWKEQQGTIVFPNGSRIILGHFQTEKDIDNYLGLQYDGAIIEEATQLSDRKRKDIGTVIRSSKEGWRPRQYFTTNPGNIGHGWFKGLFITPLRRGAEHDTRFIQATVYDNRFVNPEYRQSLEDLTGWQKKAWLLGDWDIAAGQFFTSWSQDHHVIPFVDVMPNWPVWEGFDYGFTHYTYISLQTEDGDGNVYILDEYARRRTLIENHSLSMAALLERNGIARHRLQSIAAGLDVFSKNAEGGTIAKQYDDLGWNLTPANVDRINGAAEILKLLGDPLGEVPREPKLFVVERCTKLIECLPNMVHDENRPEDVMKIDTDDDGNGGDDPYDSCRYGLMSRTARRPGRPAVGGQRPAIAGYR